MGMCLGYFRLSERNAELLLKEPILIHRFMGGPEQGLPPVGGFWKTLFGRKRAIPNDAPALDPRTEGDEGDADKAWNAIHYILTGTADGGEFPAGFILHGGNQVGDEEVGYGPARLLSRAQLTEVANVLDRYTRESVLAQYDGPAMDKAKVYPQIWGRDGDEGFEYVWDNIEMLQTFIHDTLEQKQCLLIYLG